MVLEVIFFFSYIQEMNNQKVLEYWYWLYHFIHLTFILKKLNLQMKLLKKKKKLN